MNLNEKFNIARRAVLSESVITEGVGGLSEKSVHKILKLTLEPNPEYHEVKFLGSIADIKNSDGIIEIQTKYPERLEKKLEKFLEHCNVTLVIPLIKEKYIRWIDTETSEISPPRKSPKSEDVYTALNALFPIAHLIFNPNFSVKLIFLTADEYKRLDGYDLTKKKGASKSDRIPSSIVDVIDFLTPSDYKKYIPEHLTDTFLAKDFAKTIGRPARFTYYVIRFFVKLGYISVEGKEGRAILYKRKDK